MFKTPLF